MSNFVRNEGTNVIVGSTKSNLVLETLGKVYIKTGNNYKLLNETVSQLNKTLSGDSAKIGIVNNYLQLLTMGYPGDGRLIYCADNNVIYLSVDGKYVAVVNVGNTDETVYVKKSGDNMQGQLKITYKDTPLVLDGPLNKAPIKLNSGHTTKVEYLNCDLLDGYEAKEFAIKNNKETINGKWIFTAECNSEGNWIFEKNITILGDSIIHGRLTSPSYASGYAGHGWQLDSTTNTLTIDNLVVRKLMQVYEMVINTIKATNGSMWISNSSKIDTINSIKVINKLSDTEYTVNGELVKYENGKIYLDKGYYVYKGISSYDITGDHLSNSLSLGIDTTYTVIDSFYFVSGDVYINDNELSGQVDLYEITEDFMYSSFTAQVENEIVDIYTYFKYFGSISEYCDNYKIVKFKEDVYPTFDVGDIIRCQKFISSDSINYYDALVLSRIDSYTYVLQKAYSVFDKYSSINYDSEGNINNLEEKYNEKQYDKVTKQYIGGNYYYKDHVVDSEGNYNPESSLGFINKDDELIQIGNIYNKDRQGVIYLTSTDDQGPYIDILDGIDRPDFSVLYKSSFTPLKYDDMYIWVNDGESEEPDGNKTDELDYLYVSPDYKEVSDEEKDGFIKIENIYLYNQPVSRCLGNYSYFKPTKVRLGKLDGIYNEIFKNKQPHGYGLYGENVYLTGEFYLSNGKSVASFADDIKLIVGDINTDIENIKNNYVSNNDLENAGMHISKDQIVLWADAIKIATEKDELGNPSNYTALFSDGKLSVNTLEAVNNDNPELLFYNKINNIIKIDNNYYQIIGIYGYKTIISPTEKSVSYNIENNTLNLIYYNYEETDILGLAVYDIKNDKQYCLQFNELKDVTDDIDIDKLFTKEDSFNSISEKNNNSPLVIYNNNKIFSVGTIFPPITVSINKFGYGEIVHYWESGFIMNCKIFKKKNNIITGCQEYFFNDNSCSQKELKKELIEGNYFSTKFEENTNGCVKIIDYFKNDTSYSINYNIITSYYITDDDTTKLYDAVDYDYINNNVAKVYSKIKNDTDSYKRITSVNILSDNGGFIADPTFTYNNITYDVTKYLYKDDTEVNNSLTDIITNLLKNSNVDENFNIFKEYIAIPDNIYHLDNNNSNYCRIINYNETNTQYTITVLTFDNTGIIQSLKWIPQSLYAIKNDNIT